MTADHVGYAVKSIDEAKKHMQLLGYRFGTVINDVERGIRVCFAENDGICVELVAPLANGSPVDEYLMKNGPAPYHICYRSSDIEKEVENLIANKFRIMIPLAPAVAFKKKRVVFLYSLSIGIIEIVEE